MTKFNVDLTSAIAGLDKLDGTMRESLARRMAVTGGRIIRDEAQLRALQSHAKTAWIPNPKSRGSESAGELADAIYVAFNEKLSTKTRFVYSVSWNNLKAWWGRLREFGYWQRYRIWKDETGVYHTDKKHPLPEPRWHPADPFLAPAHDAKIQEAGQAMIARGAVEFPKLMRGDAGNDV